MSMSTNVFLKRALLWQKSDEQQQEAQEEQEQEEEDEEMTDQGRQQPQQVTPETICGLSYFASPEAVHLFALHQD